MVLIEAIIKAVSILTVKQGDPTCLFSKVLEDRVIFLG